MYKIAIYLDNDRVDECFQLLGAAKEIAKAEDSYEVYGIGFNLDEEKSKGKVDYLINIKTEISKYDILNSADKLFNVVKEYDFNAILVTGDDLGKMLAPRLAFLLKTGIVADVISFESEDEDIIMYRPAFSGKLIAGIKNNDRKNLICTIRAGIFKAEGLSNKETAIINYSDTSRSKVKVNKLKEINILEDIDSANFIIGVGDGAKKELKDIKKIARKLNGRVAVSKKIVDNGIETRKIQIGQSGKIVSPKIYIAIGVSGSIQHIVGLRDVEKIITVNNDKKAPICSISDVVIVGNANVFIDKLLKRLNIA